MIIAHDLTGRTVGKVRVIGFFGKIQSRSKGLRSMWRCQCLSCGKRFQVITQYIKNGCYDCNGGVSKGSK